MRRIAVSKDSVGGYLGSMPWKCDVPPVAHGSWVLFPQVTEPKRTRPVPPHRLGSSGDPGREVLSVLSARGSRGLWPQRGVGRLLPASGELGPRGECSEPALAPPHGSPVSGEPAPSGSLRRRGDAVAACQDMAPALSFLCRFSHLLFFFFKMRRLFQRGETKKKQ